MKLNDDKHPQTIDFFIKLGAKTKKNNSGNWELQFYHSKVEDKHLDKLQSISNLESLVFYLSNITDSGVAKLKNLNTLKKLGIYSCRKVTDLSIKILSEINLDDLAIIDTSITEDGKNKLKMLAPKLNIHSK